MPAGKLWTPYFNYTLPEPNFHFFVAPMYATGSKTVNGIGRVGYNIMSYGVIRKTEILLSASKFTMDSFVDSTGRTSYMEFNKLVPGIKLTFRNKDAKSKVIIQQRYNRTKGHHYLS